MISAFKNSVKIPEVRKRLLFTFALIAVCRLAANIPVPGIDGSKLAELFAQLENSTNNAAGGVLSLVNIFSGGALQKFAVAALGIMPYISASIIMQLMTPVVPSFEKLSREGETGRQTLTQYTRYAALVICVIQGYMLALGMENPGSIGMPNISVVTTPGWGFRIMTVIILMAGTMVLMWLGEQMTERGIGNGVSLIITVNIVSRVPAIITSLYKQMTLGDGSSFTVIHLLLLIVFFVVVTAFTVALSQGVRQIPIRYAARMAAGSTAAAQTSFMPLKVNYSGVMPLIFAGAILMFPGVALGWMYSSLGWDWASSASKYFQQGEPVFMFLYGLCILVFSFFWVANQFNPIKIADDLKRNGAYVPGIRPGEPTAHFIDHSMTHITVAGSTFLIALALIPMILAANMKGLGAASQFFGGSSLLIMVGVMLDVVRQMEAQLIARNYEGFLTKGNLRGRKGN